MFSAGSSSKGQKLVEALMRSREVGFPVSLDLKEEITSVRFYKGGGFGKCQMLSTLAFAPLRSGF